jgi:hypothetical protein
VAGANACHKSPHNETVEIRGRGHARTIGDGRREAAETALTFVRRPARSSAVTGTSRPMAPGAHGVSQEEGNR